MFDTVSTSMKCHVCNKSFNSPHLYEEHEASLFHQVHLKQVFSDCELRCKFCEFTCTELTDYSKHVDDVRHKKSIEFYHQKLAVMRRLAAFSDKNKTTSLKNGNSAKPKNGSSARRETKTPTRKAPVARNLRSAEKRSKANSNGKSPSKSPKKQSNVNRTRQAQSDKDQNAATQVPPKDGHDVVREEIPTLIAAPEDQTHQISPEVSVNQQVVHDSEASSLCSSSVNREEERNPAQKDARANRIFPLTSKVLLNDRRKKWESIALRHRVEYLKTRSRRMLADRINRYRLVPTVEYFHRQTSPEIAQPVSSFQKENKSVATASQSSLPHSTIAEEPVQTSANEDIDDKQLVREEIARRFSTQALCSTPPSTSSVPMETDQPSTSYQSNVSMPSASLNPTPMTGFLDTSTNPGMESQPQQNTSQHLAEDNVDQIMGLINMHSLLTCKLKEIDDVISTNMAKRNSVHQNLLMVKNLIQDALRSNTSVSSIFSELQRFECP